MDAQPRLYTDLAWVWPFVSPPEDYVEEAATFRTRFARHGVADGASILHLGCGGGSIDWHLKAHYQVTGVDLSPAMLEHARALNPEVRYLTGDVRDVRLQRTFDAVLLHDAVAYMTTLADLHAAYATAAAHLEPGGVVVTLPEEVRQRFRQHRVQDSTYSRDGCTVTTVHVDFDPDPADTWFEQTFVFLIREPGKALQIEVDTHRCGLWDLETMLSALRDVGFEPRVEPWELSDEVAPGEEYLLITAVK